VRFGGEAADREGEAADACLVQPLQVVDEERDRLGLAELLEQGPDSQRYGQGIDLASLGFDALEGNRQRSPLRTREGTVGSLRALAEQLGKPGKRQSSLEPCRSDRKQPSSLALSPLRRGLHQTALARTRIADHDRAPATVQGIADDPQNVLAAEQPERGAYLLHADLLPDRAPRIEGSGTPPVPSPGYTLRAVRTL
jgi:hypothetical protein